MKKIPIKLKIPVRRFKAQSNHSPLKSTSSVDFALVSTPTNSSAKELWAALTPNSKEKATSVLK